GLPKWLASSPVHESTRTHYSSGPGSRVRCCDSTVGGRITRTRYAAFNRRVDEWAPRIDRYALAVPRRGMIPTGSHATTVLLGYSCSPSLKGDQQTAWIRPRCRAVGQLLP